MQCNKFCLIDYRDYNEYAESKDVLEYAEPASSKIPLIEAKKFQKVDEGKQRQEFKSRKELNVRSKANISMQRNVSILLLDS